MNYIKTFFSTLFCVSISFTAFSKYDNYINPIILASQAEVDAFAGTLTSSEYEGSITINGGHQQYGKADDIRNVDALSRLTKITGHLTIGGNSYLNNLEGLSNLTMITGRLTLMGNSSLANVDDLSKLTTLGGLQIENNPYLTNVDGLSNLTTINYQLLINNNRSLTNLDGLSNLTSIGTSLWIEMNTALTDCCGIKVALADKVAENNPQYTVSVRGNTPFHRTPAKECDTKATILATDCDAPKEGSEVAESEYKKNLYSLTRWELADCETTANLKFTKEGKYTKNGGAGGTYTVKDKDLTLTPTGGTAQKYTITKMTKNVMHLNDASGNETIYGRKLHLSAQKLAGTNWEDVGVSNTDFKFINETEVELINSGQGVNITATYVVDNTNKTITFQFSPTVVANNPGLAPSMAIEVASFNFMMLRVGTQASGIGCLNRIR